MKVLLFLLLSGFYLTGSTQIYLKLNPTPESSPGACDASIDVEFIGATPPFVINWWNNHWQVSNGMRAENLCAGQHYTVTFTDSNCYRLETFIYINPDPAKQIYPGYTAISLPSNSSTCDGSAEFHFDNTSSIYRRVFNSGSPTQDSVFNSLCEASTLAYYLFDSSSVTQYNMLVSFLLNSPQPCVHFDSEVEITEPSSSSCDGSIIVNTTGGLPTYMDYYIIYSDGGGAVQINNSTSENYADSVCVGPHYADVSNGGNHITYRYLFYVPESGMQPDVFWNVPDSLPPTVDTLVLSALFDCDFSILNGIDTAYVNGVSLIGNGQYQFIITAVSGSDTINYFNAAIMDTTHGTIFELVIFCDDLTRSSTGSVRNIFYLPPAVQVPSAVYEDWRDNLNIFPNPASEIVQILNLPGAKNRIDVMSIVGEVVSTNYIYSSSHSLDISGLADGYYIVRITDEYNTVVTKKIMILRQ